MEQKQVQPETGASGIPETPEAKDGAVTKQRIADYIENLKFRKKIFGGADEYDVFRGIKKLDSMYAELLKEEKLKSRTLLAEKDKQIRALICWQKTYRKLLKEHGIDDEQKET